MVKIISQAFSHKITDIRIAKKLFRMEESHWMRIVRIPTFVKFTKTFQDINAIMQCMHITLKVKSNVSAVNEDIVRLHWTFIHELKCKRPTKISLLKCPPEEKVNILHFPSVPEAFLTTPHLPHKRESRDCRPAWPLHQSLVQKTIYIGLYWRWLASSGGRKW